METRDSEKRNGTSESPKQIRMLKKLIAPEDLEDRICECVQVDVDQWDARACLLHGPNSVSFRKQREREAADLAAYYSGPDPFETTQQGGDRSAERQPVTKSIGPEQQRAKKGERKVKEIVKFPIDTPVEVALRFETGKQVEGRYGDQFMYSLVDNRVMYVPPFVDQRIKELAIAAGESLLLCKQAKTDGNRKWIEWSVRRAPQQPLTSPNEPAAAESVPTEDQNHRNGNTKANGRPKEAGGKALVVMPNVITGAGITAMELALNGAAEIAQRVEGRAAANSYSLRFSNEDIRAIALTIFIQAMREGGPRWQQ